MIPIFIFIAFALASYMKQFGIRKYFFRILIRGSVIHNYTSGSFWILSIQQFCGH
jgi:hypothetical protein